MKEKVSILELETWLLQDGNFLRPRQELNLDILAETRFPVARSNRCPTWAYPENK